MGSLWSVFRFLWLVLGLGLSFTAHADFEQGYNWLGTQQQEDGRVASSNDIANSIQSTYETLQLIASSGKPQGLSTPQAITYLQQQAATDTELLAQLILLDQTISADGESLAGLLNQNSRDGGFGSHLTYASTPYDTAWALLGLAKLDDSSKASLALQYLVQSRQSDGMWLLNDASNLYVTALAAKSLALYRFQYPTANTVYLSAVQTLLAQKQSDGLWGEDFVSARVIEAILPSLTNVSSIQSSLDALAARQLSNGSWSNDVFTTALALRVLHTALTGDLNPAYGSIQATVIDAINNVPLSGVSIQLSGQTSKSVSSNTGGQIVIDALEPGQYQLSISQPGYQSLQWVGLLGSGQDLNLGNLYLLKADSPSDLTTATIQGRVTEYGTSVPLPGVQVEIAGTSVATQTNSAGEYVLLNIPAGNVTVRFIKLGYNGALSSFAVAGGTTYWLSPVLKTGATSNQTPASLFGTVTDSATGLPINDAVVSLSGANTSSVLTDTGGQYLVSNLATGTTIIQISMSGYYPMNGSVSVQNGQSYSLSPALTVLTEPEPSPVFPTIVKGVIADNATSDPVAGAVISFALNGENYSAISNSQGVFEVVLGETGGSGLLQIAASGYQSMILSLAPQTGFINDVGTISLFTQGAPTLYGFSGVVVDSLSNTLIPDAQIDVQTETQLITLVSDENGEFSVNNLPENQVQLSFAAEGYIGSSFAVYLDEAFTDFGTVRLKPENAPEFNPDLVVTRVDNTSVQTDPVTLNMTGQAKVTIENKGIKPAQGGFRISVFHDQNGNGQFDAGDTALGESSYSEELDSGVPTDIWVAINQQAVYRDVPISAWVDIDNTVVETEENNNTATSASFCEVTLSVSGSALAHKLKWHWKGTPAYPSHKHTMGPFVVGQLTDDNGDGKIDQNDKPDVAFTATTGQNGVGGVLTVVDGATGSVHWQLKRSGTGFVDSSVLALGDIDKDGIADLVSIENYTGLLAIRHDGVVMWAKAGVLSSVRSGAISLADLDQDGNTEIVVGNRVFDRFGNTKWIGVGDYGGDSWGHVSLVADVIPGSPGMEVVAGRTVYSSTGQTLWHNTTLSTKTIGKNAIGNFDDDPEAEIVLMVDGRVFLLNHDGSKIWGPVTTGGKGGAPTVADFDGDGKPEIGVAGSQYYTVLETDGTIKWKATVSDFSSSATGSSVFDFDADGRSEVVYADEKDFWIFDGKTGAVKLKLADHNSITRIEYPVIADIDGDSFAEVIFGSNGGSTNTPGVRAIEAATGNWAPTRAIWNQHSYHVNNINDDASIPRFEAPSWASHNTYRLNTFPSGGVLDAYDLTLSQLKLTDNGTGQPFTLTALIGNSGQKTSPVLPVAFYRGLPSQGGTLIGNVLLSALAVNQSVTVTLSNVQNIADGDVIYAVVNAGNIAAECRADNNSQTILASAVLGDVNVSINLAIAVVNDTVTATSTVQNTGVFTSDYQLEWVVEDSFGNVQAALTEQQIQDLLSGAITSYTDNWNVANTTAGNYRVHAWLKDLAGKVLDEAYASFMILPSNKGGATNYDAAIHTDQAEYRPFDDVQLSSRIRNLASNATQEATIAQIRVTDPNGVVIFSRDVEVAELAASGIQDYLDTLVLQDAMVGTYTASILLWDASLTEILANDVSVFQVTAAPLAQLAGYVTVSVDQLVRGEPLSCTDKIINRSASVDVTAAIEKLLVNMDTDTVQSSSSETQTIPANVTDTSVRNIDTARLAEGHYACVLRAVVNGETSDLGFAAFTVVVPPVDLDTSYELGDKGRLLILLDAVVQADGRESWLRGLLDSEQWSYTIVYTAESFASEQASGQYMAYGLLANDIKLPLTTQQALASDINAGKGLLVTGGMGACDNTLEAVLGIQLSSLDDDHKDADDHDSLATVVFPNGSLGEGWLETRIEEVVNFDIDLVTALQIAYLEGNNEDHKGKDGHQHQVGQGHTQHGQGNGYGHHGDQCPVDEQEPVVTANVYGLGVAVFIDFDVVNEGTADASLDSIHASLLKYSLEQIQPEPMPISAPNAVPVNLTLQNKGIATGVRLTVNDATNANIVAGKDWVVINDSQWQYTGSLLEDGTLTTTLYTQLLDNNPVVIPLIVETSVDGINWNHFENTSVDIVPVVGEVPPAQPVIDADECGCEEDTHHHGQGPDQGQGHDEHGNGYGYGHCKDHDENHHDGHGQDDYHHGNEKDSGKDNSKGNGISNGKDGNQHGKH